MMSQILLTGYSGFVGRHVASNYNVHRVVLRESNSTVHNFNGTIFKINDLDGLTNWTGAFENITSVIHLAGLAHSNEYDLFDYNRVNVDGTIRLAREAAKSGVKRFVFVSSIGVNGRKTIGSPFSPNDADKPHSPYARSKNDAEMELKKIALDTGLEVVIVRPTLVYGPDAPGNFGTLAKLVHKLPILPFGLANNRRDFISVQNLADLLITCATHPSAAGHTFLASDCKSVSIKEFTNAISEGLGKKVMQLPIPISLMRLAGKITGNSVIIEQLFDDLQVDSENTKEVLGWSPPFTIKQAMASLRDSSK